MKGEFMNIIKRFLLILFVILCISGCTWKNIPEAPTYSKTETIPISIGVELDKSDASKYYGQKVVDLLKEMKVFEKTIYPCRNEDAVDAVLFLSINGGWDSKQGRNFASGFFTMGLAGASMSGTHNMQAVLKTSDQELARYSFQVYTNVNFGTMANTNEVSVETDKTHSQKMAVQLANL